MFEATDILWSVAIGTAILFVLVVALIGSMVAGQKRYLSAERRRLDELRKAERRYKDLFDSVSDIVYVHGLDGRITDLNAAGLGYLSRTSEDILSADIADFLPAHYGRRFHRYAERLLNQGSFCGLVPLERHPSKQKTYIEFESVLMERENSASVVWGIGRDVTDRLKTARALRRHERRFRRLVSSSPVPTIVIGEQCDILYGNPAAARLFGFETSYNLGGVRLSSFLGEADARDQSDIIHRVITHLDTVAEIEMKLIRGSGEIREVRASAVPVWFEGRMMAHVVYDDVTERRSDQRALAREKERLSVTLRSIEDGVIATDREGRVILMSRAAEDLTGVTLEDARGKEIRDVFRLTEVDGSAPSPDTYERICRGEDLLGLTQEAVLLSADGSRYVIAGAAGIMRDDTDQSLGAVIAFQDISEKKRLEKEIISRAKMESIGLLASGIAHDFNNILAGVLGSISVARELTDRGCDSWEPLDEARMGILRARGLTRQLMTMASGELPVIRPATITDLIRETATLSLRGTNVKADYEFPDNLWPVNADTSQLSQVFTNLIINADQAMPMGGTIRVSGSNISLETDNSLGLSPGRFVRVDISDEGVGIPDEHIEHIFEPFYTTKDKGTGLGLASVLSVIKNHGGHISVRSKPGNGTTFTVHLPASESAPEHLYKEEFKPAVAGGEVLVVDDDDSVLSATKRMLQLMGYQVSTATLAEEAVRMYKDAYSRGEPYAAVVMDLLIPGGPGGMGAIGPLLKINPEAMIIAMSAHLDAGGVEQLRAAGFRTFLRKPFTLQELADALEGGG